MTPQKKAKELIGNYKYRLLPFITFQTQLTEADLFNKCKQCALIAIDEIIEVIPKYEYGQGEKFESEPFQYWQEVKQEIKNL
jgi:hypothetical protein